MASLRGIDRRVQVFLLAEAVSAVGSWATFIAIWSYAAYEFDASPRAIGLFGLAMTIPPVVLAPATGTLIDRFGPRWVLAAAKVLGVVASLALLTADDFTTLAVLSVLHGVSGALALPALQSLPPRLVDDEALASTNALVSLTDEFAIVAGPVVGAVAIAAFGFRGAFVVDALTYALGLAVLPLVSLRPARGTDDVRPASLRTALDGLALIARTPALRRIVATVALVNVLYGAAILAEPLYVRDTLERSPTVFALLQTIFGVCLVAGGVLVARLGDRLARFDVVAAGVAASGLTAVVYLGTPWLPVAVAGVAAWGVCTALLSGPTRTLLQRRAPEGIHGRVLSADLMAGSLAQMIGMGATTLLLGVTGVPGAVAALASCTIVGAALLARADRREAGEVAATPAGLPV